MNTKTAKTEQVAGHIECGICKTLFAPLNLKQKYCSDECKAEAKREANRRFYRVHGTGKADPKNQVRTLVEQYLWARTGEMLADGWTGGAGVGFARRTAMQFAKLEPLMNADAKHLLADAQKLVVMLNVRALCSGKQADLTTIEQSEQTLREALAVALDALAQTMTPANTEAA
jgi:predicted nucleic acid-binding Zn ribbon protein